MLHSYFTASFWLLGAFQFRLFMKVRYLFTDSSLPPQTISLSTENFASKEFHGQSCGVTSVVYTRCIYRKKTHSLEYDYQLKTLKIKGNTFTMKKKVLNFFHLYQIVQILIFSHFISTSRAQANLTKLWASIILICNTPSYIIELSNKAKIKPNRATIDPKFAVRTMRI